MTRDGDRRIARWWLTWLAFALLGGAEAAVYLDATTVGDGPFYLDAPGETYRLTEDLITSGSGLIFAAENVTLDLAGHTLAFGAAADTFRYGVAVPPPYPHANPMWTGSDITRWHAASGATIRNGTLLQEAPGPDCAAFIAYGQNDLTVEELTITIFGDDTFALQMSECSGMAVSGCTILDSTSVVTNRHAGRAAIDIMAAHDGAIEISGNTIFGCRQWGIRVKRRTPALVWGHVHDNEIYPNTIVTNGYAIGIHGDRIEAYGNTIDATNGRGIHIELCDAADVHENTIAVIEQPFWAEYARVAAHGIKLEYCTNAEVYANTVTSRGYANTLDATSNGAALVIGVGTGSNNWVHENTFIARHLGGALFNPADYGQYATALEVVGIAEESGLVIEGNEFITEDRFFSATLWHGPNHPDEPIDASGVVIRGNTWTRQATTAPTRKYDLFFMDTSVTGLRFVDNAGGDFTNFGTGWPWLPCAWRVAYSGVVRTEASDGSAMGEVPLEVRDGAGQLVAAEKTNTGGMACLILDQYSVYTEGLGPAVAEVFRFGPYRFTARFPSALRTAVRAADESDLEIILRR